ncbi:hypothetical protein AYO20_10948 [Fonsecaea nubica]|uniref:Uncharacterized protein n=1 Tax=Fonsecaea nubica TaxID=856822 RepID=A0A178C1C4_9EURO|nr:hypothetical protein AYO20_10948 [Fonsecaea nubica]OAL23698.1 hypothetical protein AYO20_10948 [Fonsecaea nubica]
MASVLRELRPRPAQNPYDPDASRRTKQSGPRQTHFRLTQVKGRAQNYGGLVNTFRLSTPGHVFVMDHWKRTRSSLQHAQENEDWTLVTHRATRQRLQKRLSERSLLHAGKKQLRKLADANEKAIEASPDPPGVSSAPDRTPDLDEILGVPGPPILMHTSGLTATTVSWKSKMTESKMTESKMTESRMTENKMTENKMTESRITEGHFRPW